jgi:hypothetical protein
VKQRKGEHGKGAHKNARMDDSVRVDVTDGSGG